MRTQGKVSQKVRELEAQVARLKASLDDHEDVPVSDTDLSDYESDGDTDLDDGSIDDRGDQREGSLVEVSDALARKQFESLLSESVSEGRVSQEALALMSKIEVIDASTEEEVSEYDTEKEYDEDESDCVSETDETESDCNDETDERAKSERSVVKSDTELPENTDQPNKPP